MIDEKDPETLEHALDVISRQRLYIADQDRRLEKIEIDLSAQSKLKKALLSSSYKIFGKFFPKKPEIKAILDSTLFDEDFYRGQLTGRADKERASLDALGHYLLVGGFEGLNPSKGFDSAWYLVSNPDVKAAGLNPLVHYVCHGRFEGRLPYRDAKPEYLYGMPTSCADHNRKMWAGFHNYSIPELRSLLENGGNIEAAWYLAGWHYAHGQIDDALHCLQTYRLYSKSSFEQRLLIGLCKCYTLLEMSSEIESLMFLPESRKTLGASSAYLLANALSFHKDKTQDRLSSINEIFYQMGLAGIEAKDPAKPLALGNIQGELLPLTIAGKAEIPLVSVIVPAFNAGDRLSIALDSLLAQTWPLLEIIVVDDASTDDTAGIAQSYAERDLRIRYLRNQENQGAYKTRNNGMRAAQGEFVTVHDSDDWSHPQKIERQILPLLRDASKVASCSSWVRVTDDLRFVGPWMLSEHFSETNHSSCLVRRSALEKTGFWDSVSVAADTEFLWRLERHYGHEALVHVLLNTPLSFALSDESTLTRTKATHVKTIHYGLRRIYRESARWWHRSGNVAPVMRDNQRPFPLPLGIVRGGGSRFDFLLVADFAAEGDTLTEVIAGLKQYVNTGKSFCLLHWPDYLGSHAAVIADEVFEICQQYGIAFAHSGLTLSISKVVFLDTNLCKYPPATSVCLNDLEVIEDLNGTPLPDSDKLKDYFTLGGVE